MEAKFKERVEELSRELKSVLKKSKGKLLFQDTRLEIAPVVYEEIITSCKHIRIYVDCLNGSVVGQNNWRLLELIDRKLHGDAKLELVIRQEKGCKIETLRDFKELAARHKDKFTMTFASKAFQEATNTMKDGEVTGFFVFTVGDDNIYRQEMYDLSNSGKPIEAYNGFRDPAHAKELINLFDEFTSRPMTRE